MVLTSCGERNNEFIFIKVDSGLLNTTSMIEGSRDAGILYVIGSNGLKDNNIPKRTVNVLSIDDLEYVALEYDAVLDEGYILAGIFPLSNGGFWIYQMDLYGDEHLLKRCSSVFEVEKMINLIDYVEKSPHPFLDEDYYNFIIYGSTQKGYIVIWTPETIFMLDADGNYIQSWDVAFDNTRNNISRIVLSGDNIYHFLSDNSGSKINRLYTDGTIGQIFKLNTLYSEFFVDGNGKFYLTDSERNLYILNENGDVEFLFSWSNINPNGILSKLIVLSDNQYIALISGSIYFISKTEINPQNNPAYTKQELLLACHGEDGYIKQKVHDFNRHNSEYKIEIVDYDQFDDGVTKLNIDILAGNAPDMIYWGNAKISALNSEVYSNAGQLVNLYTLLNKDDNTEHLELLPNLLTALESSSGALYELPIEFIMQLIVGSVDVVGTELGWTFDEYFTWLEKYPKAQYPFGTGNWQVLLGIAIANNYDSFINWEKSVCYFESDEFIQLLQMTKEYSNKTGENILPIKLVQQGQQLLSYNVIGDVSSIQKFKALFGGEVTCIGFPTTYGVGNSFVLNCSISIISTSQFIEPCWQFLQGLVSYEEQITYSRVFPVNYRALQERLNNPAKYEEAGATLGYRDADGDMWSVTFEDATPEESEQVRHIIETCDRVYRENRAIMKIIEEEVPAYFYDNKPVEEVARIIQVRAQNYVSEQMG